MPPCGSSSWRRSGARNALRTSAQDERLTPVLDAISAKVVWVSEKPGDGHRLKLVMNAWVLTLTAGTAQSVALAQALGVEPRQFLDLIAGGPLDAGYAQLKGKAMLAEDFTPAFALGGAAKDAGLIREAAREAGVATDLVVALERLYGAAGDQNDDMAAIIRAMRVDQK